MKRFIFWGLLFLGSVGVRAVEFTTTSEQIEPGIELIHQQNNVVPWSIYTLKFDRKRTDLKMAVTHGKEKVYGLSTVKEQVRVIQKAAHPIAALNGDFFIMAAGPYQGDPRGLQINNGELISAPGEEAAFWVDIKNQPQIAKVKSKLEVTWPNRNQTPFGLNETRSDDGVVLFTPQFDKATHTTNGVELVLQKRMFSSWLPLRADKTISAKVIAVTTCNGSGSHTAISSNQMVLSIGEKMLGSLPELKVGMKLKISTKTTPGLKNVQTAIGGGPTLLRDGKIVVRDSKAGQVRNPRSAIGWNDKNFFFVAVDGRREGISAGMTFPELAEQMLQLGCTEALNLDGGGSTTLWVNGKVANQPSGNQDRNVANALILLKNPSGKTK